MLNNYEQNNYLRSKVEINAVSGTLVKNYRKSFLQSFDLCSDFAKHVLCEEPFLRTLRKNEKEENTVSAYYDGSLEKYSRIVVIQTMLCGKNCVISEMMWKGDFDEMFENPKEETNEISSS